MLLKALNFFTNIPFWLHIIAVIFLEGMYCHFMDKNAT